MGSGVNVNSESARKDLVRTHRISSALTLFSAGIIGRSHGERLDGGRRNVSTYHGGVQ